MTAAELITTVAATKPPDVGNLSIIPLGAAIGGLAGGLIGRARHLERDEIAHLRGDGIDIGGAIGFVLYATSWVW